MWNLSVSVPDHCLFFYIVLNNMKEIQVIVLAFSCFGIHFPSSRKKHFFMVATVAEW